MKKSFFLLVPAAFGLLMMSACSDDSSAAASNSNQSSCALNPSETGLEINCNGESYGFLKTSSKGVYGSCGAEALKDDSGYKLVCGGDSVGVVYNGIRGRNGENGTNGLPGPQGEQGANGSNGAPGASCRAEQVATGFDLYCGEEKVGTILNGSNGKQGIQGDRGYSCSVEETLSGATIECEDGTGAVITNGLNGENCTVSGLLQVEENDESEFFGQTYNEITCDGEPFKLYNGTKGAKGDGCSAEKDTKTGVTTITCGDDEAEILDGAKGADGKSCSVSKEDGVVTISCETDDGDVEYTVTNGTNGTDGKSCEVSKNAETGIVTITCETDDGDVEYTVKDGYGCSSTAGVGYVDVKCQTGVDETGEPTYSEDRILAAGYVECGSGVYESSKGKCTDDEWAVYTCGTSTAPLEAEQFCYEGKIYAKAEYWTETSEYPTATYGQCGESYYQKYIDACVKAYTDAGSDPVPSVVPIIGTCGGAVYDARESFCAEGAVTPRCGTEKLSYDPEHFCSGTNVYAKCGGLTYDPETQECDTTTDPVNPTVVAKSVDP